MKKLRLTKAIASTLVIASVLTLNPVGVSAEWRKDYNGWWYAEDNSWATGWKQIDGEWYYFDYETGYMVYDATVIGGYYLDSNGVWRDVSTTGDYQFYKQESKIVNYIGDGTKTILVIPDNIDGIAVKRIGGYTFSSRIELTSVTIPNSVTSIGCRAFSNCSNLKSLEIPSGVTNIEEGAFYGCDNAMFYVKNETTKQLLVDVGVDKSRIRLNGQSSSAALNQNSSGNKNNVSTTVSENIDEQIVTFPDKNLEQIVRNKINKPTGELYKSEVKQITSLIASAKNIKSINGIENLTNLKELYLTANDISDVSALKGLTNLQLLCLNINNISDLSSLKELTNLKELSLNFNRINDITVLKGFTNLQKLELIANQISDKDKQSLKDALSNCKINFGNE